MINRSLFYRWNLIKKNTKQKTLIINFGPQHPAAHGVLRLILQLNGEIIQRVDIHIGLLHRGTETLITKKHYVKSIPYFDRLDYVSMMTQEHAYCLAIEQLTASVNLNITTNYVRILFDELTRVMNHLLAVACHALDIGSMSSIFWAFEEREKLMEFYERVSGARMHAAYNRPNKFFLFNIDKQLLVDILFFIKNCYTTLNEMHNILTHNKIWKQRLINIGVITYDDSVNWGLTGVLARSTGLRRDLRLNKKDVYSNYNHVYFRSFCGVNGDTYDRYLIRMLEMGESLSISNFIVTKLLSNFTDSYNYIENTYTDIFFSNTTKNYSSMEDLIKHFIQWHTGFIVKEDLTISALESPKGEFGVILSSNSTATPSLCKIRSPSYYSIQALPKLCQGHYLADLAALIGTIDIVFGEVDR